MQCKSVKAGGLAKAPESSANRSNREGIAAFFGGARGVQTLYMTQHAVDERNTRDGESNRHLTSGFH
jgi:hypothetical protein